MPVRRTLPSVLSQTVSPSVTWVTVAVPVAPGVVPIGRAECGRPPMTTMTAATRTATSGRWRRDAVMRREGPAPRLFAPLPRRGARLVVAAEPVPAVQLDGFGGELDSALL